MWIELSGPAAEDIQLVQDQWLLALLEAMEGGLFSVTDALLNAGVDPCPAGELPLTILDRTFLYQDERPRTALDKCVLYGHEEIANRLLESVAGVSITPKTIEYAIDAENLNILRQYLATIRGPGKRVGAANGLLHRAVMQGKLEAVKFSLHHGALIESEDCEHEYTALGLAVFHGQSGVVQYLLNLGLTHPLRFHSYRKTMRLNASTPYSRKPLDLSEYSRDV